MAANQGKSLNTVAGDNATINKEIEQQKQKPKVRKLLILTNFNMQSVTYNAEKIIGNGSFGVVFKATIAETGEQVAIKKVFQD